MSGALSGIISGTVGGVGGGVASTVLGQALPQLSGIGGIASQVLAFIRQPRSIGTIIPDVTIEEHFEDRLQVTQHPRAQGSPMSDHAYLMPKQVTMRCGWTNANPIGALTGGIVSGIASGASLGDTLSSTASDVLGTVTEQRAKQVYDKLLALQFNDKTQLKVTPFDLTAGKRTYKNMVITDLSVTNNHQTEYALIIEVRMQEVITIQDTDTPTQSSQTLSSQTASPSDNGTQQTTQQPDNSQWLNGYNKLTGRNFPGYSKGSQ